MRPQQPVQPSCDRQVAGSTAVVHMVRPVSVVEDAQQSDPGFPITENPVRLKKLGLFRRLQPNPASLGGTI